MKPNITCCVVIFLTLGYVADADENDSAFVPTNEWQTIKEGQSIPAGLHVRINLETGKKEAKLLTPDEKKEKSLSIVPNISEAPSTDDHKKLEEAMKGIPSEDFTYTDEELKAIKTKFKSYDSIKKEFKDADMNIETDAEIMEKLFGRLQNAKLSPVKMSANETSAIFEDLQYLLHQVDNALDFITKGGLETLIIPNLANSTNARLTVLSLRLLAAITQNNPKAQIAAFERNIGDHLTRIMSVPKQHVEILVAGIGAFGSLVRHFPIAQKELFAKSGLNVLIRLLSDNHSLKIKLKTVVLITDLMREGQEASLDRPGESETIRVTRLQQYHSLELEKQLNATLYCQSIDELFVLHRADVLEELDTAEKTIQCLIVAEKLCYSVWSASPLFRHTLLVVKNSFDNRLLDIGDGNVEDREYFGHLLKQLNYLNHELYKHIVIKKDEL